MAYSGDDNSENPVALAQEQKKLDLSALTNGQLQAQAQLQASQLPAQPARVIPEELRNLTKFEVTFFMDRIPSALKSGALNQQAYT